MTIEDTLKAKSIEARKAKATHAVFLVTVLAAIQKIGKDDGNRSTTDAEAIKVLKSFVQSAKDTKTILLEKNSNADTSLQDQEISILEEFIPKQLSLEEIQTQIKSVLSTIPTPYSMKTLGAVMAHFNKTAPGLFEGATVKKAFQDITGIRNA